MAKPTLPKIRLICSARCEHKIMLDTQHPDSHYGLGIMRIVRTDRLFDAKG